MLNQEPEPNLERCGKLFVAAKIVDPEAIELEVTAPKGCNVRSEPKINSHNVMGTVLSGARVLARNSCYSWLQVQVDPDEWFTHSTEQNVGWVWDRTLRQ